MKRTGLLLAGLLAVSAGISATQSKKSVPYLIVLGIAQDGGVPQAGSRDDPRWDKPDQARLVVCLGLVDSGSKQRWMFEATPDFKRQLHRLDQTAPFSSGRVLEGIFLTHAHIGHYLGLALIGHESMGARKVPVHAMPRMAKFLRSNGPWDQLVRYGNIDLRELQDGRTVRLNDRLTVTPIRVPHRQEYSEVVGFRIQGRARSALFIPDIDSWEEWDRQGTRIEDLIRQVDVAYLDGSFFANGEIPGRDMSGFPHPMISHSLDRFSSLPEQQRNKIRFIHLNHTNPALQAGSDARRLIEEKGMRVAEEGEIFGL